MFCKFAVGTLFSVAVCALLAQAAAVGDEKRGIFDSITSDVGHAASEAVSAVEGAGTALTSVAGQEFTILTDAAGDLFTLATSGAGVVTSIGGSLYTVATADLAGATSHTSSNAALGVHALSLSTPLLGGLLTVLVSVLWGAWILV